MKRIASILLLVLSLPLAATNYYVKDDGNDADSGLSDATAWQTLSQVTTEWYNGTFAAGDSILLKRGVIFYGKITVWESGTSGSPIVIGAYGTGAAPIITGMQTLVSWTQLGGGSIYYATVSGAEDQTNIVVVDGVPVGMGRYPDAGTNLTYTTGTTSTITDPELPASPDYDGAEVVISKTDWVYDRCLVTDHTGTVVTYSNLGYGALSYI